MKYVNANAILPEELVKELQEYLQAGYIYVPAKKKNSVNLGANCLAIEKNFSNAIWLLFLNIRTGCPLRNLRNAIISRYMPLEK